MEKKLERKLYKNFSFMKKKNIQQINCGNGWFQILHDMCKNLKDYDMLPDNFVITAVEEKCGDLEVWSKNGNNATRNIINKAKDEANIICDECGNNKDYNKCPKCTTAPIDPNYNPLDYMEKIPDTTSATPNVTAPPPISIPNISGAAITIGDCQAAIVQWCMANGTYIAEHEFGESDPVISQQIMNSAINITKWDPYPANISAQWQRGDPYQSSWVWLPGMQDEIETSISPTAIVRVFDNSDLNSQLRGYAVIDNNQIVKAWAQGE